MSLPQKTPLYQAHVDLGARMVDFHGWLMPMQYNSIMEEVRAVRNKVGIFDISHMGEAEVKGQHAFELLQNLTPNDLAVLEDGQAQYTVLLNEDGGVIDDLLVYKVSDRRFFLCLNASNVDKDVNWLADQALQYPDVEVTNLSRHYGLISLQGPNAERLLKQLTKCRLEDMDYYHFTTTCVGEHKCILARTGYTGEDGFEIFLEWRETADLWKLILKKGKPFALKPIGLGARDILRLEVGYPLHGNDIDEKTTPLEAGLGWTVKLEKNESFIGRNALEKQKREGLGRKLVGIEMTGRGIPRAGFPIMSGAQRIGEVTSGTMSPTLGKAIALGYVSENFNSVGSALKIDIRGKMAPAVVVPRGFVPSNVKKPALPAQGS